MKNMSILVVEDEAIIAYDLASQLSTLGFHVLPIVSTSDEAYRVALSEHPELILMDVNLNDIRDGIDTYGMIRGEVNIPVIFLTAYTDEITKNRASQCSPLGFFLKPAHGDQLFQAIQDLAMTGIAISSNTGKQEQTVNIQTRVS